jgi:hypothetical protein
VTRIGELGTTLAVTNKRNTQRRNVRKEAFLMIEAIRSSETSVLTRTTAAQETAFFIVTAVKTSNLTTEPFNIETGK